MNPQVVIAFVACFVAAQAGVLVEPSAKILQGPSSKTTIVGNDGSVISAVAPGGQIIHEEDSGVVAHAAPVIARYAPAVARYAPAVAHYAPTLTRYAPAVTHYAPASSVALGSENVIVAGPSGTISTSKLTGPVFAEHGPVLTRASPVVAHYAPVVAYTAGHEYERAYLHNTEALYHDGSYKAKIYGY